MNWTEKQAAAIAAKPCTLLVSAAAGSGKTAVLTERIVEKIVDSENELTVENIAVVTFTKAAAGELKDRLYQKLSLAAGKERKNHRLNAQLMALSSARISTIHSFCFSLLRENASALSLSPAVTIADPVRADALLMGAAKKTLRAYYAQEKHLMPHRHEDFLSLLELCGVSGDDKELLDLLIHLYHTLRSYPAPMTLIGHACDRLEREIEQCQKGEISVFGCSFFAPLAQQLQLTAAAAAKKLEKVRELCLSLPTLSAHSLEVLEEQWEGALRCSRCAPFDLPAALKAGESKGRFVLPKKEIDEDLAERIRQLRKAAKKDLDSLREQAKGWDPQDMLTHLKKNLALARLTDAMIRDLDREYEAEKKDAHLLDYADLEQLCAQLLCRDISYTPQGVVFTPTDTAKTVSQGICELYVDEYQDTNLLQDMIFRAVSRPGRMFLVGDPKQSVYGFRGAKPEIFARYKNTFPDYNEDTDATEQKLLLSNNFRCDKTVIDLTNRIFSLLMNLDKTNPLYTQEDQLIFTKASDSGLCAEILVTDRSDDGDSEDEDFLFEDPEAAAITHRISALLGEGILTEKGSRLALGDIAVLARDANTLRSVRRSLVQAGIPCTESADDSFLSSAEILFFRSLLQLIDNPHHDIALASVLNSPVFSFSPDDLLAIREKGPRLSYYAAARQAQKDEPRLEKFFTLLDQLREYAREHSLCDLVLRCLEVTDGENIYAVAAPAARVRKNIRTLLDLAAEYDRHLDCDPAAFLEWIDAQSQKAKNTEDGSENAVHLMTVHHSKGLEFPCVIVAGLAKSFNKRDLSGVCLFDPEQGLSFRIPDREAVARIKTAHFSSVALRKKRELLEEEKRLLYVAMTRARQKLILSAYASPSVIQKKLSVSTDRQTGELLAQQANSLWDLVLAGLWEDVALTQALETYTRESPEMAESSREGLAVFVFSKTAALRDRSMPLFVCRKEENTPSPSRPVWDKNRLYALLEDSSGELAPEQIPKKLSVSALSPLTDVTREPPVPLSPQELFSQSKTDGAFAGTAAHQFMQFCDFAAAKADCKKEADRLTQQGFLSPEQKKVLRWERLERFFASELYGAMEKSPRIHRELRFHVFLPAALLIDTSQQTEVLLQGVIDCFFENPDGSFTLLDFKTDSAFGQEGKELLRQRHSRQLQIYRLAVEKMTGSRVSRLLLWSFSLGEAVEISPTLP